MAFPGDYGFRAELQTDNTKVASDETDFPYYFDLSNITDSTFWNNVQSDGGDLRVSTDESGSSQIPLEVVSIDTTAETGEIHFKSDTDASADQSYYLWWGDSTGTVSQPATTDPNGRNAVWARYGAVWHLSETSGGAVDSTGNGNTGTYQGNLPNQVTGKIGTAQDGDGNGDYVDAGDDASMEAGPSLTVTGWMNNDSYNSSYNDLISKWNDGNVNNRAWSISIDGGNGTVPRLLYSEDGSNTRDILLSSTPSTNDWHYYDFGYNDSSGTIDFRVDAGSQSQQVSYSQGLSDEPSPVQIFTGVRLRNDKYVDGTIDEVRISTEFLSTNWRDTQYNIQDNNASFWTVASVETTAKTISTSFFSYQLTPQTTTALPGATAQPLNYTYTAQTSTISKVTTASPFNYNYYQAVEPVRLFGAAGNIIITGRNT